MSEPQHEQPADDTEGNVWRSGRADAEGAEGDDDTEGHMYVEEPRRPDDPRG